MSTFVKNEDKPLSRKEWNKSTTLEIAKYHGFKSRYDLAVELRTRVPSFNWNYQSYLDAFEITKSPLWRALS